MSDSPAIYTITEEDLRSAIETNLGLLQEAEEDLNKATETYLGPSQKADSEGGSQATVEDLLESIRHSSGWRDRLNEHFHEVVGLMVEQEFLRRYRNGADATTSA